MYANCVVWAAWRRITKGGTLIVTRSPLKRTCVRVMHKDDQGVVRAFVPAHRRKWCGCFAPWCFRGRVVVIRDKRDRKQNATPASAGVIGDLR
jgi:hypothetical protein